MPRERNTYSDRALDLEIDRLTRRIQALEAVKPVTSSTAPAIGSSSPLQIPVDTSVLDPKVVFFADTGQPEQKQSAGRSFFFDG